VISKKLWSKTKIWAGFITILSLLFLLGSIIHRSNLDSTQYTQSLLAPILIMTMLLLMLCHFINYATIFVFIFSKAWKKILFLLCVEIVTGIIFFISIFVDSSTFIFMT